MQRRFLAGLLTLTALTLVVPASAQTVTRLPPRQDFRPVEPIEADVESEIIDRTNAFRTEHGQGALTESAALTAEARDFAAYLARTGGLSHTADGRNAAERARAAGYEYCEVAENLASEQDSRDFRDVSVAKDLVDGWENSPSHRHNMLDPQVVEIGVGVARAPDGAPKYVAVQVFGRPATLRFAFKVTNRTHLPVSYAFAGKTGRLEPGTTITQSACAAGLLVFNAPGAAGKAPYPVEPGALYILQSDAAGGVQVEILRRGV